MNHDSMIIDDWENQLKILFCFFLKFDLELIVRQVQEKVMDIIKDQVLNPSSDGIPGFSSGNMFMKLNQFLRPADNNAGGRKQIFNVSFHLFFILMNKRHISMHIDNVVIDSDVQDTTHEQ